MNDFLEDHDLSNLVHFPTCFKNNENPREIDLIVTKRAPSFQNTIEISPGHLRLSQYGFIHNAINDLPITLKVIA